MSSFQPLALRRFSTELSSLLDKRVRVIMANGYTYEGKLLAYDQNTLNLILANAKDEKGEVYARALLNGHYITQILRLEEPFDLRGLAEVLEKSFPNMVVLHEDAGVITIMDRIRVTESGVIEGSGPIAERVKKIFEDFIASKQLQGKS
ncbi:MAG: Lsm family RNA-binding protein [Candidatus Nezhaarchaeota archaeon]|nr:Lsm family RNA-binding protein [Candidatus Nezhaarchaeota archaeon]MCX8141918.1 Lsm family RNA-binding protein [Candidatus Nezhaarchaeota archaeon]MDW8050301.1 Lsm family RNA-binding protein [Nitrososphaerota archaeon]